MSETLKSISSTAIESITSLNGHRWGIPVISQKYSMLSQQEQQVLALAEKLLQLKKDLAGVYDSKKNLDPDQAKELQDLSDKLTTNELVFKRVLTAREIAREGEGQMNRFIETRDELDVELMSRLNSIRTLTAEITELERDNAKIHERNRALVKELTKLSSSTQQLQESQFSVEERAEYEALKQTILANRSKSDILSELIVAMITATGVNWATDTKLRDLVLKCGEFSLREEKFLFDS